MTTHNYGSIGQQIAHQTVNGNVYNYTNMVEDRARDHDNSEHALDQAILGSLAFPHMTDRRRNIESPHHQTCQWILQVKEYQLWSTASTGLLWIKGKPGAGKSTLMSHLYRTRLIDPGCFRKDDIYLDFFFTARGTPLERSPTGMLRSLLNQIFRCDSTIRQLLRISYQEKQGYFGSVCWDWQESELQTLFTDIVLTSASRRQVVIFIDALDEAGEHAAGNTARFFHRLSRSVQQHRVQAKVCISSRHYPIPISIQTGLEIHVENHNQNDILSYIQDYFDDYIPTDEYSSGVEDSSETWEDLVNTLASMANGVFQWARLVLPLIGKRIGDGDLPDEVLRWLHQVSTELDQVYRYIFEQVIERDYRSNALRLFRWVCFATRPLTLTELRYALATHDLTLDPLPHSSCAELSTFVRTAEVMKRRIQSWSGGLLEAIENSQAKSIDLMVVQPIHFSVNNFFLMQGPRLLDQSGAAEERLPAQTTVMANLDATETVAECNGELYRSCLKYMASEISNLSFLETHPLLQGGVVSAAAVHTFGQKCNDAFPFLNYVIHHTLHHAQRALDKRFQDVAHEAHLLDCTMSTWTNVARLNGSLSENWPTESTVLHIAAAAHMTDLVIYLLEEGADLFATDVFSQTALHRASEKGHLAAVKVLVEAGADKYATSIGHETPINLAASRGHSSTFSWLLSHETNAQQSALNLARALYVAAGQGQVAVVKLCIEAGALANVPAFEEKPLQIASLHNHLQVVRVLLEAGDEVNAQGGYYGNALQAASCGCSEEIVQMLLDAGAKVNVVGGAFGTALQAASYVAAEGVVRILLASGADVNALGGEYGTALQAASLQGKHSIVQILLGAGADANVQGGAYGTALEAAATSSKCHPSIVAMLLAAGSDVNAQGGYYGNALQAASLRNTAELAHMLLDAGADVNSSGGHYGNALQAACSWGNKEIVRLLLDAGADVNAQGGHHGDVLKAASSEEILRMLLEARAAIGTVKKPQPRHRVMTIL